MIRRNIPNTITLGNLFCGCLAIIKIFEGDLISACWLIAIAAVLDFFDGFVARLLKVTSPIGKDLDSLADMVTFGVVPGFILYFMTDHSLITLIVPVFSCIRLAKFNNDFRQTESFIGLPTPANAIIIAAFPLIKHFEPASPLSLFLGQYPYFLHALAVVLACLLLAPLPLFSFKFKHFKWRGNRVRYGFLVSAIIILFFFHYSGIIIVNIAYILLSTLNYFVKKIR